MSALTSNASDKEHKKASIEKYQKLTPLEHILKRPDTYIGSIDKSWQHYWIIQDGKLINKSMEIVPGLFKIFDEIIVNARDHSVRDASVKVIKVMVDPDTNTISVYNNGEGIPVELHTKHNVYIPELVFGHLLTGTNFDDTEKKTTGGRNGYGAKLTNIFSTEFTIETSDGVNEYRQTFRNNMQEKDAPTITPIKKSKKKNTYTRVTFKPDLERFNLETMSQDIVNLFQKRTYDIAALTNKKVKVYFGNGSTEEEIKLSFQDYVDLYCDSLPQAKNALYSRINDNWEVAVAYLEEDLNEQVNHISYVNGICTSNCGTHVKYIVDQVVNHVKDKLTDKKVSATLNTIRARFIVFVNATIVNPSFDSQSKERLKTPVKDFGSTCELPKSMKSDILKSGVVDFLSSYSKMVEDNNMKKIKGTKTTVIKNIPKLEDATNAGKANKSKDCTLILTEGDSAKALVISGLSSSDRDYYGVFPLKGKLLNVRDATSAKISNNTEITNIIKIMGLHWGREYEDVSTLRYGKIMILTDQDVDGSHIKGLVLNMFHDKWPSLFFRKGFLNTMATPLVKAKKGKLEKIFYNEIDFNQWYTPNSGWVPKYYKGLGASTGPEARKYFENLGSNLVEFSAEGNDDTTKQSMSTWFSKDEIQTRKEFMMEKFNPSSTLDATKRTLPVQEFLDVDLGHYAHSSLLRAIASLMDGFKPSSRKVLFGLSQSSIKTVLSVGKLTGIVSTESHYHHGEKSLEDTIINMAQSYVGSNNINLLLPDGQFGTRLEGGKDHAAARYIHTRMQSIADTLFRKEDYPILERIVDDGVKVEPTWYCPIMPMVLVNGVQGIATAFSTTIPPYNPLDIVANIKRHMDNVPMVEMTPWYRGFTGTVTKVDKDKYEIQGSYQVIDDRTIRITELPIGLWTSTFKITLEGLMEKGTISKFINYSKDNLVHIIVTFPSAIPTNIIDTFKLKTSIRVSNMYLHDEKGIIKKYTNTNEIIKAYYDVRIMYYEKRKQHSLTIMQHQLDVMKAKIKFINAFVDGEVEIMKDRKPLPESTVLARLKELKFPKLTVNPILKNIPESLLQVPSYSYATDMKLFDITKEKVDALEKKCDKHTLSIDELTNLKPTDMWKIDLDAFLKAYAEFMKTYEEENQVDVVNQNLKPAKVKKANATTKTSKPGKSKPVKKTKTK